ncbi:MAG: hypothetical protein ACP5OG_01660 [Candidatus Nanoarchaeia archaeon]
MGMNAQLHLILDSEDLSKLQNEAKDQGITLSDLCRQKLFPTPLLKKLEFTLDEINSKLTKIKKSR